VKVVELGDEGVVENGCSMTLENHSFDVTLAAEMEQ
jgi:hypothetical protein